MPINLYKHGETKFPNAGLIATSLERGWMGVAAELRAHPAGELPAYIPAQMELTMAIRGNASAMVARKGNGQRQNTQVRNGTLWLCPEGVGEDDTNISGNLPEILHIYLPPRRFTELGQLYGDTRIQANAVGYLAAIEDELLRQLCLSIRDQLLHESAGGRLLVESASLALTARLAQAYSHDMVSPVVTEATRPCPDRIGRAVQFIQDNLHSPIGIADLADAACLSPFHFARIFKQVTGRTPHAYVSEQRLEVAKRLLSEQRVSLTDVAEAAGFSSQAAFTRRFKATTGLTPGQFRQIFA